MPRSGNQTCAFVECTSLQAEGHAREIKEHLGISVLPMTVGDMGGKRWRLRAHIKSVITTIFHNAELLPLRSRRGLEILTVLIEASPSLRKPVGLLKEPIVFLETEKQMARDITEDAKELLSDMSISTRITDSIPTALHEILVKGSSRRDRATAVLLSPLGVPWMRAGSTISV